jgi:hypothetical protein
MSKPHVHAEVIKAWADGKTIQTKIGLMWIDMRERNCPTWANHEYRVKPETIRYRVALFKPDDRYPAPYTTSIFTTEKMAHIAEHGSPYFVRWLTDWTEVEI